VAAGGFDVVVDGDGETGAADGVGVAGWDAGAVGWGAVPEDDPLPQAAPVKARPSTTTVDSRRERKLVFIHIASQTASTAVPPSTLFVVIAAAAEASALEAQDFCQ
jgi:hypothetical protein